MDKAYNSLKKMKLSLRIQLLKENLMEEDELRETTETLATMVEEYKQISFDSSDESDDEQDREVGDDY